MIEIPRYRMTNNFGHQDNDNGAWVRYEDHVAALKAARNELPDVGSWSPAPKFKVGDLVTDGLSPRTPWVITKVEYVEQADDWYYSNNAWRIVEDDITLHDTPTPSELIPTLKEHEWVQGTYKTGTAFGPCTTYFNEIGAMFAGDNNLIHWNSGAISDGLATIERCDAPEVG